MEANKTSLNNCIKIIKCDFIKKKCSYDQYALFLV